MYPAKVKLNALAIKKLVLSGKFEGKDEYEISVEFSSEELQKFENNFVVIFNSDYYIVPLDCSLRYRNISECSRDYIELLEEVYEKLYKKLGRYYCSDLEIKKVVNIYGYPITFEIVEDRINEWFNDFVISNGRLPNENEIKGFLISYLTSYDLKSEIEDILRKAKLISIK